jgi:hypothetical protein
MTMIATLVTAAGTALATPPDDATTIRSMAGREWPANGAISGEFTLRADAPDTLHLHPDGATGHVAGPFLATPFLDARIFFSRNAAGHNTGGGINFTLKPKDGKDILFQLPLSRLAVNQRYFLVVNWASDRAEVSVNLQGTPQGDLGHWRGGGDPVTIARTGDLVLGQALHHEGKMVADLVFRDVAIHEARIDDAAAAAMAAGRGLVPLNGEARTIHVGGLDLDGLRLQPLHEARLDAGARIVRETELLDGDGQRVRLPPADAEWILEGDHVTAEPVVDGLRLTTARPDDGQAGAWVLWLNREIPADCLIEYDFTPEADTQGLNIVFFAARNPRGETIFDLDLPVRHGSFRDYIVGAIDSYHISPWATDGTTMRRTANMRKNTGFMLVAVGNDLLAGTGENPKRIRVLHLAGNTTLEANGIVALVHHDDGIAHGPRLGSGLVGIRFMAHTRSATLHRLRIQAVAPASPPQQP